jgi:hypothetical protein
LKYTKKMSTATDCTDLARNSSHSSAEDMLPIQLDGTVRRHTYMMKLATLEKPTIAIGRAMTR